MALRIPITNGGSAANYLKFTDEPTASNEIRRDVRWRCRLRSADGGDRGDDDVLFPNALRVIVENRKASTSLLQRRLKVGYGRAAAMLDSMERQGLIGPIDGAKPRQVLGRAHELVSDWDEQGL